MLAERVGFEPTEPLSAFTRSPGGRVRPTTLPLQFVLKDSLSGVPVGKHGLYHILCIRQENEGNILGWRLTVWRFQGMVNGMEIATIQAMMKRLLSSFLCVLFLFTSPLWARAAALPEQAFVSGVTGHAQSYGLSCESRSAADVAAFWGASVSETEILNALPRSDDPEIGFVGDVNGAWGYVPPQAYGVHAQPIAKVLQQYGLDAEARQNMTWEEAQAEIAP